MTTIASQITSLTIVYPTFYSCADQSKHQSSASLAFVWGIHRGPVNSPHKGPVTRKMFPFDDVIMNWLNTAASGHMERCNLSNVAPTESCKMSERNIFLLQLFEYQQTYKPTYKTGYRRSAYSEVNACFKWCTQSYQYPICTNHLSARTKYLIARKLHNW